MKQKLSTTMANQVDSEKLSYMIKSMRGKKGLRETAKEIDISAPTLSRIEKGKLPDIDTYLKLCKWLNVSSDYFSTSTQDKEDTQNVVISSLRADKTLSQETTEALINMINLAFKQVEK